MFDGQEESLNLYKTEEFGLLALRKFAIPLLPLLAVLLWCSTASASTTGKIAGIVTNAETGEPLQGATIRVQGNQMATETDSDGEFYIINVPVGEYSLAVSMLGYETIILKNVRVLMDLTTPVEFEVNASPIQMDRAVTVVATRPLILRDKTSSGAIVTRDEIAYLANARNVTTVLSTMTGTVVDADSSLHVRGGRNGSVSYFFDGFSIQDPFNGNLGMRIVPDALEELSLTSGGLAPEYGEALSGVVNAITREGGDSFHGRVKAYDGSTDRYDVNTGAFSGLSRTHNDGVSMDISGPVARFGDRLATFFGAVEYVNNDGYLPHSAQKLFSGVGKLVMFPTVSAKLTFNGSYYFQDRQRYVHRDVNNISYDFNLDGLGKIENEAYLLGVKADYNKSANTVLSASANYFRTKTRQAPESLFDLHWDQWPGYMVNDSGEYNGWIDDSNYVINPDDYLGIGFTTGDDYYPYFLERIASYTGGKFSVLSQVDKFNQIKFGGDLRRYELHWDNRQFFNAKPYGETYDANPWFGAGYLQDKIELVDMIVNLGIRFDYLYSDVSYWHNPFTKDFKKKSKAKVQWSPRLGISHPVSENSVLHFNYGYLFQPPTARLMYTNLQGDLETGYPLIGNPDLEAEKTIYYELGLSQVMGDNLRLNLTTYYRDIKNMIGAREVIDENLNHYTVFTNSDYGSAKGFDLSVSSIRGRLFNWSMNYSYLIARGNASDPYEWYYDYYTVESNPPTIPTREYPLAYDQRHSLTAVADFRVHRGQKLDFLGWNVPDAWGVNLLARYGSGLTYTKTDTQGFRLGALNGEHMPYTLRCDLRFNKNFYFAPAGGSFLSLFVEVENLFDRRNIVEVYPSTGEPDNDAATPEILVSSIPEESLWRELYDRDPQHYDHPRQLRVGMEFNF